MDHLENATWEITQVELALFFDPKSFLDRSVACWTGDDASGSSEHGHSPGSLMKMDDSLTSMSWTTRKRGHLEWSRWSNFDQTGVLSTIQITIWPCESSEVHLGTYYICRLGTPPMEDFDETDLHLCDPGFWK